jgi:hypothetical protein
MNLNIISELTTSNFLEGKLTNSFAIIENRNLEAHHLI